MKDNNFIKERLSQALFWVLDVYFVPIINQIFFIRNESNTIKLIPKNTWIAAINNCIKADVKKNKTLGNEYYY